MQPLLPYRAGNPKQGLPDPPATARSLKPFPSPVPGSPPRATLLPQLHLAACYQPQRCAGLCKASCPNPAPLDAENEPRMLPERNEPGMSLQMGPAELLPAACARGFPPFCPGSDSSYTPQPARCHLPSCTAAGGPSLCHHRDPCHQQAHGKGRRSLTRMGTW